MSDQLLKIDQAIIQQEENKKATKGLLQFLKVRQDDYSHLSFSPEEAQKIRSHLSHLVTGATAAIPLICFTADALVTLDDLTVKEIKDIQIGDYVLTHTGSFKKVTRIYQRKYQGVLNRIGLGQSFKSKAATAWSTPNHEYLTRHVTFSKLTGGRKDFGAISPCPACGKNIKLNGFIKKKSYTRHIKNYKDPEHVELLKQQGRSVEVGGRWIPISSLIQNQRDFVASPSYSISQVQNLSPKREALAVVLGFYLAEGCIDLYKRDKNGHLAGDGVTYTLHRKETHYAEQILKAWQVLGYDGRTYYNNHNGLIVKIAGRFPAKLMNRLGGRYSDNKKIHPAIFQQSDRFLQTLLRSCFFGDAGLYRDQPSREYNDGAEIGLVSRDLIWQLYNICLKLNLPISIPVCTEGSSKGVKKQRKDVWSFYMSARATRILFENQNEYQGHHFSSFFDKKILWRKINKNKILHECQYDGLVYNLEVEDDHSYIVNGVAVHNCGGASKCPFSFRCPLVRIDNERKKKDPNAKMCTPVGSACLIEVELLEKWTFLYIDEYEIDEESFTDLQIVRELAEIELMLWRLNNNLAKPENASLIGEVPTMTDKQGNVHYKAEPLAFLTAKETLQNRKSKLIKLMVGDRQEKYKRDAALKLKAESDVSTTAAQLRNQVDQLLRKTKDLNLKLKEAEGEVIEGSSLPAAEKPATLSPEDLIDMIDHDEEK